MTTVQNIEDYPIAFGKYKGQTFGQVYKTDASYINWVMVQKPDNKGSPIGKMQEFITPKRFKNYVDNAQE